MSLITGATTKVRDVGGGAFLCPACRTDTTYVRVRASRYFTFFFIPLFPIRTLGEYIRCAACQAELEPEVAKLSRDQILQITAPWLCSCRNLNAATQNTCLACGAARQQAPPPMPGQSPQLSAAALLRPAAIAVLGPGKKRGIIGTIFLILGGLFVLNLAIAFAFAIWGAVHSKDHPNASVEAPGKDAFEEASKSIFNNDKGVAHGNSPEAEELAAKLSAGLGEAYKDISAVDKPDLLDQTGGKFLVFCQLDEDSCVFLVHVPNLRHFNSRSKQSIAEASYLEACLVLRDSGAKGIRRVVVATRGTILYATALVGSYPPQQPNPQEHVEKLEVDAGNVPGLYHYFTTETSAGKEAPTTPAASETPAKSETPAPPAPRATPSPATTATPAPLSTPSPSATPAPLSPTPTPPKPLASAAPATDPPAEASATPETSETPAARRPDLDSKAPPSWVPIYPAVLKPAHGLRRESNGVTKGRAMFETADPLAKVKEFYENRFKADGFEITSDISTSRLFENAEIAGKKVDGNLTLRAEIHQMKARTIVNLIYEGAEKADAAPAKPP